MEKKNLQELQQELDAAKWNDGMVKGSDPCGTYDYCAKCDKTAEYPCAQAKVASETVAAPAKAVKAEKPAKAEKAEKPVSDKVIRARKPRAKKA